MKNNISLYDEETKELLCYNSLNDLFFDLKIYNGKGKNIKIEVGNENKERGIEKDTRR